MCLGVWCKQIDQVLVQSEQMRKEADDIGPAAELDHWKQRMAKFSSLLDEIKTPKVTESSKYTSMITIVVDISRLTVVSM